MVDLKRMEAVAADLSKIGVGAGKVKTYHDADIARMAELSDSLNAKAYSGGWVNLLNWPSLAVAPAAVNTFTTTTCIMSPAPPPFIPANSVSVRTLFRVRGWGTVSSVAGTATTTLGIALNGTGGTVICASANQTPATTTVFTWWAEFEASVQTLGSSGTIIGVGWALGLGATPATMVIIPASAPATVTMNTTIANSMTLNGVWSVSNASNTYTCYGGTVEQLN